MASDGKFLYLLIGSCLIKIGSGFSGTYKGHIYGMNNDFSKDEPGWLGYCRVSKIYFIN